MDFNILKPPWRGQTNLTTLVRLVPFTISSLILNIFKLALKILGVLFHFLRLVLSNSGFIFIFWQVNTLEKIHLELEELWMDLIHEQS